MHFNGLHGDPTLGHALVVLDLAAGDESAQAPAPADSEAP